MKFYEVQYLLWNNCTDSKQNMCGVFTIEGSWRKQKIKMEMAYRLQQSGICVVKTQTQSKYENIRH